MERASAARAGRDEGAPGTRSRPARLFVLLAAYTASMPLLVSAAGLWYLPALVTHLEGAGGWAGPLFAVATAGALALALLPANAAALLAGALFGLPGLAPAVVAYLLAAVLAFEVVRRRLQPAVQAAIAGWPRARAIQTSLVPTGFRLVLLARLAPSVPFPLVNVLLGASPVSRTAYLGGTLLGMLPRTTLLVAVGMAADAALDAFRARRLPSVLAGGPGWIYLALGAAATCLLAGLVAAAVWRGRWRADRAVLVGVPAP